MALVSDIVAILDIKLWGYKLAVSENEKIAALNSGKHKVWSALQRVGRGQLGHWFTGSDNVTVTAGNRDVNLPASVIDVLSVESESVKLHPSGFHKAAWRDQREDPIAYAIADIPRLPLLWLINGTNPGKLEIGHKLAGNLTLKVYSSKSLADWALVGDDADDVPLPYHDAVANYAAWMLVSGIENSHAGACWAAWLADVELITGAAANRTADAGVVTGEDYAAR